MLEKFSEHLSSNFPFLANSKIAIAVSGGIDSMVLADLMRQLDYQISILHCNFALRGDDSDGDQNFVEEYSAKNSISFHTIKLNTSAFANDNKSSIQMAARQLRYQWFNEQLIEHNYDYVLTAHHADDDLETFFINLSRGSGIDGLIGIPAINAKVIRPMLKITRSEIESFAFANTIQWREDSSNASDYYLRNNIRHNLAPVLENINPDFVTSIQKTQQYLQQTNSMAEDAAVLVFRRVAQEANGEIHFNLNELLKLPNYRAYLYRWLREYEFTAWDDIYRLVDGQTGKQVLSKSFRLFKNRHFLVLSPHSIVDNLVYEVEIGQCDVNLPLNLSFTQVEAMTNPTDKTIFVDAEKLNFPLQIRRWKEGDSFHPFGMNGQSKKVSKLYKDEKLSLVEKENKWILCSANQIVWVIGIRQDERFKIETHTKQILKIAVS